MLHGAIIPLPQYAFMASCSGKKKRHGDNFTFFTILTVYRQFSRCVLAHLGHLHLYLLMLFYYSFLFFPVFSFTHLPIQCFHSNPSISFKILGLFWSLIPSFPFVLSGQLSGNSPSIISTCLILFLIWKRRKKKMIAVYSLVNT